MDGAGRSALVRVGAVKVVRSRDELFRLQLGKHTNQVPSTAAIETKRREVAKILTILRNRDLGLETQGRARKES